MSKEPKKNHPSYDEIKLAVENIEKEFFSFYNQSELQNFGISKPENSISDTLKLGEEEVDKKAHLEEIEKIKVSYFTMKKERAEQRRLDLVRVPIHR